MRSLDERIRERADARDEEDLPREVEVAGVRVTRFGNDGSGQHDAHRADDDVDEEDAAPPERLGEDAADERAEGQADRRDGCPEADRLRLRLRVEECRADEGQRGHVDDGRADTLQAASDDQHGKRRRQAAQRRRGGEENEAAEVNAPPPALVGERRRRHDEHRHREAVGGNHPLHALLARVELVLDVRQRDVDDRRVEVDHEQPDAGGEQRQPLLAREAGLGGGRRLRARGQILAAATRGFDVTRGFLRPRGVANRPMVAGRPAPRANLGAAVRDYREKAPRSAAGKDRGGGHIAARVSRIVAATASGADTISGVRTAGDLPGALGSGALGEESVQGDGDVQVLIAEHEP